jgi:hypothetical protein
MYLYLRTDTECNTVRSKASDHEEYVVLDQSFCHQYQVLFKSI